MIAFFCTRPLLVEAACMARNLTAVEMQRARAAWSGITAWLCIAPLATPNKSEADLVLQAVPEYAYEQPCGVLSVVLKEGVKTERPWFISGISKKTGGGCFRFGNGPSSQWC